MYEENLCFVLVVVSFMYFMYFCLQVSVVSSPVKFYDSGQQEEEPFRLDSADEVGSNL